MLRILSISCITFFIWLNIYAQNDSTPRSLVDQYTLDEMLNLTVITAEKRKQKIDEVPASVVVLNRKEIETYGYKNFTEILNHIIGFYMIEDYYWLGSRNFGVRGYFKTGPFSNFAILVNGIPQLSDKYSDYPSVKITVPVEVIERIEVIKGPMAVIYGNGAFFGAVNIITSTEQLNKPSETRISTSIGDQMSYKANVKVSGTQEQLNYNISLGYLKTDGPSTPYTQLTTDTSYLNYVGLSPSSTTQGQLTYESFYSGVLLSYKGLKFDFNFNESKKGVFDGSPALNQGNILTTNAINTYLSYTKEISPTFNFTLSAGYFFHSHFLNYELFRKYYYEVDYQKTNSLELDITTHWQPFNNVKIASGINRRTVLNLIQISDFAYYGLNFGDGEIGLPFNETFSNNAIYTQATFTPLHNLAFVGGLRIEYLEPYNMYYSRGIVSEDTSDQRLPDAINRVIIEDSYHPENNGITLVPKAAVIYQFLPNHFVKFLYSEAQKHPSFTENYRQLPRNLPKLYSSKIRTFELNYYSKFTRGFNFNTSLFFNKLDKLINMTNIYDPETGDWKIYSANSGRLNTIGADFQMSYMLGSNFIVELSGMFQKTKDLRTGYKNIDVAYSPNFSGNGKLFYQPITDVSIGLTFQYIGSMKSEWMVDSIPSEGYRLAQDIPGYSLVGLNLRKENLYYKGLFIQLKIDNLFNTRYRYPTTTSNSWIDKGVPGQRISWLLTIGTRI